MNRRELVTGIGALICAPAIVRASSLMPVRAWDEPVMKATEWFDRASVRWGAPPELGSLVYFDDGIVSKITSIRMIGERGVITGRQFAWFRA